MKTGALSPLLRPLTQPLTRALSAAGVGGFNPLSIYAGGVDGSWIDPSDISTLNQISTGGTPVTASGDPVGRALDKSGNARNAIQATAGARPIYTTSGSIEWLDFDGSADLMTIANAGGATTAFFICIAFRCDTLAANQVLLDNRSGNTGFQLLANSANTRIDANIWNGTTAVANSTSIGSIAAGNNYIVTFWYDGTNTRVQINSTTVATSGAGVLAAGPAGLALGSTLSFASRLDGRIYGAIYTKNSNPSATDRERVKSYLAAKASVTL